MRKAIFVMTCVSMLLAVSWVAKADSLYLTDQFNNIYLTGITGSGLTNPVGGGSVSGSKLNGTSLPYDFCIGLYTEVYVPQTYYAFVTNNGTVKVNGGADVKINNAGEIAWLLTNYAGASMTTDRQIALQAAIWHIEYSTTSNDVGLDPSHYKNTTTMTYYNTYISDISNGVYNHNSYSLTGFDWITPYSCSNGTYTYYQPQITAAPEPSTLLLVLCGAFGLYGLEAFRKKL